VEKNGRLDTIIFDLGGVLIDWNPEYVYRRIFEKEEDMYFFFENICTPEWNLQQDAGRPLKEATNLLISQHPEYEREIEAYYGRWEEMLGEAVAESVTILEQLKQSNSHRLLALTNWSQETFPIARKRFGFLEWFEGIVVSGQEKTMKPKPEIYEILLRRYAVLAEKAVFIDDNLINVKGAQAVGLQGIHFESPQQLREALNQMGVW